jgi:hypothetical protein
VLEAARASKPSVGTSQSAKVIRFPLQGSFIRDCQQSQDARVNRTRRLFYSFGCVLYEMLTGARLSSGRRVRIPGGALSDHTTDEVLSRVS